MGAISIGQFDQAWSLNPLAFVVCIVAILWALQIAPINGFVRKASTIFRRFPLALQVTPLMALYGIAWIAAIARFNSGTF
jgi:NADH:ubiquinone oxidoreductase subunit 5 (subunit L)/multisubunit Na+/H+ antiporter MnhA subunit